MKKSIEVMEKIIEAAISLIQQGKGLTCGRTQGFYFMPC